MSTSPRSSVVFSEEMNLCVCALYYICIRCVGVSVCVSVCVCVCTCASVCVSVCVRARIYSAEAVQEGKGGEVGVREWLYFKVPRGEPGNYIYIYIYIYITNGVFQCVLIHQYVLMNQLFITLYIYIYILTHYQGVGKYRQV
jgi:hypothetical protein